MLVKIGATLTGGSDVTLSPAGLSAGGKATYTTPDHTRLSPEVVDFLVTAPTSSKNDPGVARSGLKISYASRSQEEGCCSVSLGTVIIDVGFRWPLGQPEAVVDDAIAMLKGLVYTAAFSDALKKGVLPTS
jgi:hypothetical protein